MAVLPRLELHPLLRVVVLPVGLQSSLGVGCDKNLTVTYRGANHCQTLKYLQHIPF